MRWALRLGRALLLTSGCVGLSVVACEERAGTSDEPSAAGAPATSNAGAPADARNTPFVLPVGLGGAGGGAGGNSYVLGSGGDVIRNCEESALRSCYGVYACLGTQVCSNNGWTMCLCDVSEGGAGGGSAVGEGGVGD